MRRADRSSPWLARTTAALLAALLLGCARDGGDSGTVVAPSPTALGPGALAAQRIYRAALDALRAADAPPMEVGELWFLQQLAAARPDPELQALLAATVERRRGHALARLVDPTAAPFPLPEDPGRGIARLAAYANAPAGAPLPRAAAFVDAFTADPSAQGYPLTHQLLVLEWARTTGLELPDAVRARRTELLRRIAAEQRADTGFSDLFAERAAILLAFDRPGAAEVDGWLAVIAAAQPANGRWTSPPSAMTYDGQSATARHPWVHTTGFVLATAGYALARPPGAAPP